MPSFSMSLLAAWSVAAAVSFGVAGLVRRVALARGIVVPPRPDRWHRQPTPTYGGVGVLWGLAAGAAIAGGLAPPAWPVLSVAIVLFVIGWYDDALPMSALAKMVSSLAAAAFFVFSLVTLTTTTPMHAALTVAAMLWFAGLVNAINLLDNMDGLAAGVTGIAAIALAVTFRAELGPALVAVLVALAGGLAGFLIWNRNPAKLFMGNCGSLAIGGVLAASATVAIAHAGTLDAAAAVALILVVPIFDSAFVVLLRRLAGRSTTRGNIDHTSHRLVSAGFTDRTAVSMLYALGAAGAVIGYLVHTHSTAAWPIAAAFGIGVLMMALSLARVPAYAGQDFRAVQSATFAPLLSDLTFRWHAGEVLLDLLLITTCYYAAYRFRFEGDADLPVFLRSFSLSLPAILGCQLGALYASGLYTRMWSTFGLHDLSTVIRAVGTGVVASVLVVTYLFRFHAFSRSVFIIDGVLLTAAIVATRSSFRLFGRMVARISPHRHRVAIYGAGVRGQMLVREMLADDAWGRTPVAFIDDDTSKRSRRFVGVPVRGTSAELVALIGRLDVEEILISSPAIDDDAEARVRAIGAARAVAVRRLFFEIK
jgi:UDP-GlcNAc:undecaprenyl-phosphate/decaprenyl-phosphate GlcNAc-1-phosphate transferase